MKKFAILIIVCCCIILYVSVAQLVFKRGDIIIEQQEQLHHQEMLIQLYEAKMDYFEELHNIDLDDTPNEFIAYLAVRYPEVYIYFREELK
jgi:hypothetical protein